MALTFDVNFRIKDIKIILIISIFFSFYGISEVYSQSIPEPLPLPTPLPNDTKTSVLPPATNTTDPVPIPVPKVPEPTMTEKNTDNVSNTLGGFDFVIIILIFFVVFAGSFVIILKKRVKIQK